MTGMTTIWGSITIYVTSYFYQYDPSLSMAATDITFPLTITTCAICMQFGQLLMDRIHPKLQMAIGTALFSIPVFCCQWVTNFYLFMFFYSFVLGLGFGMIYMLPIRNAWIFFPQKKGTVSGIILCAKSLGAVSWSLFAEFLANPHGLQPDYQIVHGLDREKLFPPGGEVVNNVPKMFFYLSLCYMTCAIGATLLVTKKKELTINADDVRHSMARGSLVRSQVSQPNNNDPKQINETVSRDTLSAGGPLVKHQVTHQNPNLSFFEDPKEIEKRKVEAVLKKHPLFFMTMKEALQHPTFWHLFVMIFFSMSYSYFIKPNIKKFGL